jgi:hypothetical protein
MNLKSIAEGFTNLLFTKELVEDVAKQRKGICDACPVSEFGKSKYCKLRNGGCGCYLPAKHRAMDEECPKNKW